MNSMACGGVMDFHIDRVDYRSECSIAKKCNVPRGVGLLAGEAVAFGYAARGTDLPISQELKLAALELSCVMRSGSYPLIGNRSIGEERLGFD